MKTLLLITAILLAGCSTRMPMKNCKAVIDDDVWSMCQKPKPWE